MLEASAGHRQDVHDRLAGDALRRRRRGRPRPADARDLQPRRHAGAARAGPGAAGLHRHRAWPIRQRHAPADDTAAAAAGRSAGDEEVARRHRPADRCARRASTPPLSRRRTASASRCWPASAWPATPSPARPSSTAIDDLVTEVVDRPLPAQVRATTSTPAGDQPSRPRCPSPGSPLPTGRHACSRMTRPPGRRRSSGTASLVAVRREVERRKRARRLLDYDDLLTRLRDALADAERGAAACARHARPLPRRARRRVPGHRPGAVGDPATAPSTATARWCSSAIPSRPSTPSAAPTSSPTCAAADEAGTRCTLGRNWRSDAGSAARHRQQSSAARRWVTAASCVRPVEAQHLRRAAAGRRAAPLRLRLVSRCRRGAGAQRQAAVGVARPAGRRRRRRRRRRAAAATGACSPSTTPQRPIAARATSPYSCAPTTRPTLVRDALDSAPGACGAHRARSASSAHRTARDWLMLLRAVEQPHRSGLVRAAALTAFVGWHRRGARHCGRRAISTSSASGCAAGATPSSAAEWRRCSRPSARRRVCSSGCSPRATGERDAHRPASHRAGAARSRGRSGSSGPAALVEWLQQRIADAGQDSSEERSRRLESDADAVQVITVHGSKGLEFPVVYVPFGWDRFAGDKPDPLRLHDGRRAGCSTSAAPTVPATRSVRDRHQAEEVGEDLRLLYVALTRAQCQAVAWWAPSTNTPCSPLHRLLFGGAADRASRLRTGSRCRPTPRAREHLEGLAAASDGAISVEPIGAGPSARWEQPAARARGADRGELRPPRRHVLAAHLLHRAHRSRARSSSTPAPPASPSARSARTSRRCRRRRRAQGQRRRPLPALPSRLCRRRMSALPTGPAFGTLVHEVLEHVDTAAADLDAELRRRCSEAAELAPRLPPSTRRRWPPRCSPCCDTPLGPSRRRPPAARLAPADRLAELDFELPLAGGDRPRADRRHRSATSPTCSAAICRPPIRSPATPTRSTHLSSLRSRCAATSPAASTLCCGSGDRRRPALRRRRLQDQLAR